MRLKELKNRYASPLYFGISSMFFIGAGLIPLPNIEHIFVSSVFFVAFAYSFFAFAILFYRDSSPFFGKMGLFAIFNLIMFSLAAIFLLFFEGVAISEMIAIIPGFFWCTIFGSKMVFSKP